MAILFISEGLMCVVFDENRNHLDETNHLIVMCMILYTCYFLHLGTTGLPKGVIHSHQTMIAYADLNVQHPGVQDLSRRNNNHFNTLALLPLFHIFGFATQMTGLKMRGTVVHNPRFQPKLFLRTIQVRENYHSLSCNVWGDG